MHSSHTSIGLGIHTWGGVSSRAAELYVDAAVPLCMLVCQIGGIVLQLACDTFARSPVLDIHELNVFKSDSCSLSGERSNRSC